MPYTGSNVRKYAFAVALGVIAGAVVTSYLTKAIPKMMPRMMQNMMIRMREEGCDPEEMCKRMMEACEKLNSKSD